MWLQGHHDGRKRRGEINKASAEDEQVLESIIYKIKLTFIEQKFFFSIFLNCEMEKLRNALRKLR